MFREIIESGMRAAEIKRADQRNIQEIKSMAVGNEFENRHESDVSVEGSSQVSG